MKIPFITQAINSLLATKAGKAKKTLNKIQSPEGVKKKIRKKPYPKTEDGKFRNVTE